MSKIDQIRDDFRHFASALFQYHKVGVMDDTDHDIAHWMQHAPQRSITLASRGRGKTTLVAGLALWMLMNDHDRKIMFVSASQSHAKKVMYLARKWMAATPFLEFLVPRRGQRDGAEYLDVGPSRPSKDPSLSAYGITGMIVGSRAHEIIGDDVETPESSLTRDLRARMRERVKEFESIIYPNGNIRFLGTPHHEETLYEDLAESGYIARSWPAVYPRTTDRVLHLAPTIQRRLMDDPGLHGHPTSPERFSEGDLRHRELSMGRSTFAMQFRLLIGMGDENRHPLKLSDLICFPCNPRKAPSTISWGKRTNNQTTQLSDPPSIGFGDDALYAPIMVDDTWRAYTAIRAYVDPSGGMGSDETAWAIGGQLHGNLYLLHVGAYQGGHTMENTGRLIGDLRRFRVNECYCETNYGGEMLMRLLEPQLVSCFIKPDTDPDMPEGWACRLIGNRATGQKETRIINCLEPLMNQHRLVVDPSVMRSTEPDMSLQWQLTRLTRERECLKYDDRIDAVAGWAGLHIDLVRQDPNRQHHRMIEAAQRERLDRHRVYQRLLGKRRENWIRVP